MTQQQQKPKYPGVRVTTNGNQLVAVYTESRVCDGGVFYPITPSTEQGEHYQLQYAKGSLNAFGESFIAIEAEGEHAAQGGAIALSVTGKRVVNFTSGQGIVYGIEQYYHAPGKLSTMILEVGARALTKHALNVHCGHDDIYSALDTGWLICFARGGQQCADQALILRKVTEQSLNPGMNCQDGMLTTHLEKNYLAPEPALIRQFLGRADDIIECPTEAQKELFGPTRRRVPALIDLNHPLLVGPVQNQEHHMNGEAARRNNFAEPILDLFEQAFEEFAQLTGRRYGLISTFNLERAETVFVCLGSAAENIEAACDYIREVYKEEAGVLHVNVLRPFPEQAIIKGLRGKKRVIVLERTDEPLSGDNPLTRDVRVALGKAVDNHFSNAHRKLDAIHPKHERPDLFTGVYGMGSRDFRPEGVLGAYEFATNRISRQDGLNCRDGERFFYVGIDHPYAVVSKHTPSLLPHGSIAVRFHSVGGWGMITTGKNLGGIMGELSNYLARRDNSRDYDGNLTEVIHINANPKYGSEKKGAPTNYFLVAAPERIRVNCDLKHVDVVLCCDPKVFLHTNPLQGIHQGGAFVWQSHVADPNLAWQYIPARYRAEIVQKKIRLFVLDGFAVAREATKLMNRKDLETRMQGNSFLGAFFRVSTFLQSYHIPREEFREIIRGQYERKFSRFGQEVVEANMMVMNRGYDQVKEVAIGRLDEVDLSSFCGPMVLPCSKTEETDESHRAGLFRRETFDQEFRADLGYHQPASVYASVGCMAAGTGANASKYVARLETPIYIAENCTQCMKCIEVCPDTALPNTTQPLEVVLTTAIAHYVTDPEARAALSERVADIEGHVRAQMLARLKDKDDAAHFADLVGQRVAELAEDHPSITRQAVAQVNGILKLLPLAYKKTPQAFAALEKKNPKSGGLFSIYVSDLCKGCAACVEACGDHDALRMRPENEAQHAEYLSATRFLELLPDTPQQYLGKYQATSPRDAKAAVLRNHLMLQSKYNALVSGDGACAGCGEKSVLRAVVTLTEALMRPIFDNKAARLLATAALVEERGGAVLSVMKKQRPEAYDRLRKALVHLILGYGGVDSADTAERLAEYQGDDQKIVQALSSVLRLDAQGHQETKLVQGTLSGGRTVMAMAAHTGCNTVYGSTPPNNPHPYPWMNSLFQDGATVGWLMAESFIQDHARRSVIPERLAAWVTGAQTREFGERDYFRLSHFSDTLMSDDEVLELPKVWVVGGDGGMGDIGYQNVSKVIMQNRPNVKMIMLDTQVYSNTGGQNSESSPMAGGFDMNAYGPASEGKLSEMKSVAESFLSGHGSPFVAQVSMASAANLYKAILDGLCYRGTAYFQAYTTCQPEHGVADDMAQKQALWVRDSRGMPEFVYNPELGETYAETLDIKTNRPAEKDWMAKTVRGSKQRYNYTVAHWAVTEKRFRNHFSKLRDKAEANNLIPLESLLKLVTMNDVVQRRYLDPDHRAFVPEKGVTITSYEDDQPQYWRISRQLVLFCVERRKAWRMLQSRAGVENPDYLAQKALLAQIDAGELSREQVLERA